MALVVISLMLFTPWYIGWFDQALTGLGLPSVYASIFPDGIWHMHSAGIHGGVVSPLILLGALLGVTALLMFAYKALRVKERIHRTWSCGYRTGSRTQYSATGFAGPIRRFFGWLYRPDEHFHQATIADHPGKFHDAHYDVHIAPLFEKSLYATPRRLANRISYWVYRLAHFEQTRYAAMIFNLILMVLFSYRIVAHDFSWATLILESTMMLISVKVLIIGDKR